MSDKRLEKFVLSHNIYLLQLILSCLTAMIKPTLPAMTCKNNNILPRMFDCQIYFNNFPKYSGNNFM